MVNKQTALPRLGGTGDLLPSQDLRRDLVEWLTCELNVSTQVVSRHLKVAPTTVRDWKDGYERTHLIAELNKAHADLARHRVLAKQLVEVIDCEGPALSEKGYDS
ncbi:MAG TPA: hypothetical protein VF444_04520 [Pseudonocardiaceae bacterium]